MKYLIITWYGRLKGRLRMEAWIEIATVQKCLYAGFRRLRMEAWIEIIRSTGTRQLKSVASVWRRGLKCRDSKTYSCSYSSPPYGGVD